MDGDDSPLLVLSDLHLKHSGERIEGAFERVVDRHPGHELILAGDVLDLSDDPAEVSHVASVLHHLEQHPRFTRALRGHLLNGQPVTWIPGNHDAGLGATGVRTAILEKLELSDDALLTMAPWFVRRGGVHIEHGHLYDPDNAPAHPLAVWDPGTEPVGVALTRQFLSRRGAWIYSHAYETTPARAVTTAFLAYGRRAPVMICQYFDVAIRLCLRARQIRPILDQQRASGHDALPRHAQSTGLSQEPLLALLGTRTQPTHESTRGVFTRLYFDRVFAALAVAAGSGSLLAGSAAGIPLVAAGALYLAGSIARSPHRIGESPADRMREGARRIRELTGASLVILGHTHEEDVQGGYVNLGSFAFSDRAAPRYLVVDTDGTPHHHRLADVAGEPHSAGTTAESARRAPSVYDTPL